MASHPSLRRNLSLNKKTAKASIDTTDSNYGKGGCGGGGGGGDDSEGFG